MIGQSLAIIVPERFRASHEAGVARVASSGETNIIGKTVEVFGQHKSGSEFPIELSLATWIDEGRRYFSGIIRDITVCTQLTDELSKSERRFGGQARLHDCRGSGQCRFEIGRDRWP